MKEGHENICSLLSRTIGQLSSGIRRENDIVISVMLPRLTFNDLLELHKVVVLFAVVDNTVHREDHLGLDLTEAI